MRIKGHSISRGVGEGEAIVYPGDFSFLGDFDPFTGTSLINDPGLEGKNLIGKVLVCKSGKGSSRGPLNAYRAKKLGKCPKAIVCVKAEPVLAAAAIIADIPMVDQLDVKVLELIRNGDRVIVDGNRGVVEVVKMRGVPLERNHRES